MRLLSRKEEQGERDGRVVGVDVSSRGGRCQGRLHPLCRGHGQGQGRVDGEALQAELRRRRQEAEALNVSENVKFAFFASFFEVVLLR